MYLLRHGNLIAYSNRYATILKHEMFSEEREWRIPLPLHRDSKDRPKLNIRPDRPYVVFQQ